MLKESGIEYIDELKEMVVFYKNIEKDERKKCKHKLMN